MKKLNPIEKSKYIDERYRAYLRSSFKFNSDKLQSLFEEQLSKEDLFKGPYVALNLPFKRGKNIAQLVGEGVVSKSFLELSNINFERPLYSHQEESIRQIKNGRGAIITTGTGSGKTESFLFPILNEILTDADNGNHSAGIRAVFLYPMNALVNDQIERVRAILTDYPDITYGFFTGDTKDTVSANYREKLGKENNTVIPPNELVSREEIRNNPPHLLFTNYSMLEYLLIRPKDSSVFAPQSLTNWKFVVLDEAHTYSGAKGIEISLLMRRLTGLAEKKPRFILTSATLGTEGKSEKQIVEFARNLTSAEFDEKDIIFSKRIPLKESYIEYAVSGEDYSILKNGKSDPEVIRSVVEKYRTYSGNDFSAEIYDLLIHDENVYDIYSLLKNESRTFAFILASIGAEVSENELIDLIDLINLAEKDGIGIFDLKYHSFVRPLAGAYVTLEKNQRLSLTKTNSMNGFKAFEVGNCRHCSAPYIIGKMSVNEEDNLVYLLQNKEVDIYENYGDNSQVRIDYFIMNDLIDDDVDRASLEEYSVCIKCGQIHPAGNKNALRCSCGDQFRTALFLVKNGKDSKSYNNINQCPCCGQKTTKGIVKGLNLGKDEGTAIMSQTILESMEEGVDNKRQKKSLSLKLKKDDVSKQDEAKVKQLLSFSDSRQQASFFAAFFEENHKRLLRKRLIWKVIEENDFNEITVNEMATLLKDKIKNYDLFPEELDDVKNAWIAILVDLLKVDGAYDSENLGLYYFDLDITDLMSKLDEEDVSDAFGEYNINKSDLETIIKVVFEVFKTSSAIYYAKSTLTEDEKKEYLEYRRFDNAVMFKTPKSAKTIKSFLPLNSTNNQAIDYVMKCFGCESDEAKDVLNIIFNNLAVEGELLRKVEGKEAYKIDAGKYVIKNYKKSKYYICDKCGSLTPYNVHNVCPRLGCKGKLTEASPDEELALNYYRYQYKNKKIERIVAKEHTAQLSREKAKKYQEEFKEKKINVLSCSTTFEMGIDIGDLETVFMRNIPPTPANYVQRAGRAGRRKDSSAYVLTFCGASSHDYSYFCEPEKMISGVITPPYFNVMNHKLIQRHLMATCLGYFFKSHPQYFDSLDELVFNGGVQAFKDYMTKKPEELNRYINKKVLPGKMYDRYHDFKWFTEIDGNDEKLEYLVERIDSTIKEYTEAIEEAVKEQRYQDAEYFKRQIDKIHKGKVIDALSRYCVIPKYGFPVDTVELEIYQEGHKNSEYDLSRDLRQAISEYAPDSEIIVDKTKYTSKYITIPRTAPFPKHYFKTCPNCRKVTVALNDRNVSRCKYCGEGMELSGQDYYIEPSEGFKTGITKESTRMKPKKSYLGEVSYLGGGKPDSLTVKIGNEIKLETSTNDELLIMNKASFYMCPECGYSYIHFGKTAPATGMQEHNNFRQYKCKCDELSKLKLGHSFQTDVTRFTIPSLVDRKYEKKDYATALSFLYALLEGISNALDISRTDIDGIVESNLNTHSFDIIVYDNVPGGAGHVKRLMDKDAVIEVLKAAHRKVSQNCCDENTSCYNCLRNYANQSYHGKLHRIYAKEFIEELMEKIGVTA